MMQNNFSKLLDEAGGKPWGAMEAAVYDAGKEALNQINQAKKELRDYANLYNMDDKVAQKALDTALKAMGKFNQAYLKITKSTSG